MLSYSVFQQLQCTETLVYEEGLTSDTGEGVRRPKNSTGVSKISECPPFDRWKSGEKSV